MSTLPPEEETIMAAPDAVGTGTLFDKIPTFKELYRETYEPRRQWFKGMPAPMPHLNKGMKADHVELRAAGRCLLDGQEYEFHDIRVYVDDTREPV